MIRPELMDFLLSRGTAETKHSGATLLNHLTGVHRILRAIDAPVYLCEAGLFHSIYGTVSFKTVTVEDHERETIRTLVGAQAEELVWAFCRLPRPQLFETSLKQNDRAWLDTLPIAADKNAFYVDLLCLECANLLEQKILYRFPHLTRHAQQMGMLDADGFSIV